jgi:hypothetical protein
MTDQDRRPAEPATTGDLGAIEGADRAALGVDATVPTAPGAEVDAHEHLVPGATFDERLRTDAKPWFTSLAADSAQAGVANDAPDAQDAAYSNLPKEPPEPQP